MLVYERSKSFSQLQKKNFFLLKIGSTSLILFLHDSKIKINKKKRKENNLVIK